MIGYLRARVAESRARRRYELARIERLMAENQRELDRIERENNAPCPLCPPERTAASS